MGDHAPVTPTRHFPPLECGGGSWSCSRTRVNCRSHPQPNSPAPGPARGSGGLAPSEQGSRQRVQRVLDSAKAKSLSAGTQIPFPFMPRLVFQRQESRSSLSPITGATHSFGARVGVTRIFYLSGASLGP